MFIKFGKAEFQFSGWLAVLAIIVADNMYANHCKTKKRLARNDNVVEPSGEEEE